MFKIPEKIIYALPEQIGNYDLFVGRKKEFDFYLGEWYSYLQRNFAQSQAILSRRKKGKTAFLQRYFNILWNNENRSIIPFYYSIQDMKMSLADFSKDFFATFTSHYLSFVQRDPKLISNPAKFEEIRNFTKDTEFLRSCESIESFERTDNWGLMWRVASRAPFEIAAVKGLKIVQIIDEFQNINAYIYDRNKDLIDSMSGSYMELAEKKEAPLIVSGSEVHWLLRIITTLTGRFRERHLGNFPKEEAYEAIEKYAEFSNTKINEEAKVKIWNLTQGDPLYIKALFMSENNAKKDYTLEKNITEVYEKEISEKGEIFRTWMEYIAKTFYDVNKKNAKRIILYLFKEGKPKRIEEIIKDLSLKEEETEVEKKIEALIAGDLLQRGARWEEYTTAKDKTYELIFKYLYQYGIDHFEPDLHKEIRILMGKTNEEKGKFREFLVREKLKKPFNLKEISENGTDLLIKPKNITERVKYRIGLKEREIDIVIEGSHEVWIDVKDTLSKYGKNQLDRWLQIKEYLTKQNKEVIWMVYSQSGYTKGTKEKLISEHVYILIS